MAYFEWYSLLVNTKPEEKQHLKQSRDEEADPHHLRALSPLHTHTHTQIYIFPPPFSNCSFRLRPSKGPRSRAATACEFSGGALRRRTSRSLSATPSSAARRSRCVTSTGCFSHRRRNLLLVASFWNARSRLHQNRFCEKDVKDCYIIL